MFKQSISKMNNEKAGRPSSLLQEMAVGEAGVEMITNIVHKIKVDGLITAEQQQLSTIADCYKGKGDT